MASGLLLLERHGAAWLYGQPGGSLWSVSKRAGYPDNAAVCCPGVSKRTGYPDNAAVCCPGVSKRTGYPDNSAVRCPARSVQRPRKRLAKADVEAQVPASKKARRCCGIVMFEDEASFWLDGTLHQTWARVGVQPRVATYGARKTADVFGAVSLDEVAFAYEFADVFNGDTFWIFIKRLVAR